MRRFKKILVLFTSILTVGTITSYAKEFTSGDFKYELIPGYEDSSQEYASITDYIATPGNATMCIPDEIDGYTVGGVGIGYANKKSEFEKNKISEVIIPDTVFEIGVACFSDSHLENVVIEGNGLRIIHASAFANCKKMEYIEIPEGVESIKSRSFINCNELDEFTIPSSVEDFGSQPGQSYGLTVSGRKLKQIVNLSDNDYPLATIAVKGYGWYLDEDGTEEVDCLPANSTIYKVKKKTGSSNNANGMSSSESETIHYSWDKYVDGFKSNGNNVYGGTWEKCNTGWKLKKGNGMYALSQWGLVDNNWYYFDFNGNMQTGWCLINNNWYYFKPSGEMVTGWQLINDYWYYFVESGEMLVNSITPDGYSVGNDGIWIE